MNLWAEVFRRLKQQNLHSNYNKVVKLEFLE